MNETFSNYASGSSANLPGCSTATSDQESFDVQLNYYQSGVSFPWTQQILAVNTIDGNSCHTVEYWPTSGALSPDCYAQMIGGSTYDPNFNTSRSVTYNEFYPEASSGTMSGWYVETFNPSDTWVIYPGSSSPNGCGSGGGGGTGLPSSISSWSTSSPKGEFTLVFVGEASGGGYVGFSRFSTSPGTINGDQEPYFMMQVWYDQADTSPLPTQIDQQTAEQSNTVYSNAYIALKASPDGATGILTQEVNCLLTESTPLETYFCA